MGWCKLRQVSDKGENILKTTFRFKEVFAMPTYEFVCEECRKTFALTMGVSEYEKKKIRCPKCKGKKTKRLISSFQTITSKKS